VTIQYIAQAVKADKAQFERIRRLRLGEIQRGLRDRYGYELPDDDAGREDLFELLLAISLGPEPKRKMANAFEIQAPWMTADERLPIIDRIGRMPVRERWRSARRQGEILGTSNADRIRLAYRTIRPFDLTDEQLAEQRKAKQRAREQRRRRAAGAKPQAESLARRKPWETKGISRATWFRNRAKLRETDSCAVRLANSAQEIVSPRSPLKRHKADGQEKVRTEESRCAPESHSEEKNDDFETLLRAIFKTGRRHKTSAIGARFDLEVQP
jgi:hypothetical protein